MTFDGVFFRISNKSLIFPCVFKFYVLLAFCLVFLQTILDKIIIKVDWVNYGRYMEGKTRLIYDIMSYRNL